MSYSLVVETRRCTEDLGGETQERSMLADVITTILWVECLGLC